MPIYSNMPESFYPRPSDVDAPLRSPLGRGPRGPQGHSITAEIVDNDPYGYFRVRFKDAQTGEVLVVTPNLDVGSRIFVTSEHTIMNDTAIGVTHSMPSSDLTPLQASSDRSAVRVGDLIVFNAQFSDETLLSVDTFGIGVVNRVDNQRGDGTFVEYDVVHFVVTNVFTAQLRDGAITSDMIADSSITEQKIANSAVSSNKIKDNAVEQDKIADGSITTPKIKNKAVTTSKLADGSVTLDKLAGDAINVPAPKIADPVEWDINTGYDVSTIVTHDGNSFTSRKAVPVGIDILNTDYWAETGNYNAQIELYRAEVEELRNDFDELSNNVLYDSPIAVSGVGVVRTFDLGATGQSAAYVGNRLFLAGQGHGNNDSVICEIDTTTGQVIASNIVPEIGHANGMCANDGYIYICNGTNVHEINVNSLNIHRTSTFSVDSNIVSLFVKDDIIHGILSNKKVCKFNILNNTFEHLFTIPNSAGAAQNATYYNGKIYQVSTYPNSIRIIDFETQEMIVRTTPSGDGLLPICEPEGIFVKDDEIYIACSPHENGGLNFTYSKYSYTFIFRTNLISGFPLMNQIEYKTRRYFVVNGNIEPTFVPPYDSFTYSLELACIIASYINNCFITVSNHTDTEDGISLRHCTCNIYGGSGTRTVKYVEVLNAELSITSFTYDLITKFDNSHINLYNITIKGTLNTYNTSIDIYYSAFTPDIINGGFRRCRLSGNITNIKEFNSGSLSAPVIQMDITLSCKITTKIIYLLSLQGDNNNPPDNAMMYVTIMFPETTMRFMISGANFKSYINGNDIIKDTNNEMYPKVKFIQNSSSILASTTEAPDTFDFDITSSSAKVSINESKIWVA